MATGKLGEETLDGLHLRERRFVQAYVGEARGNATKAAMIAGYSSRRAQQTGSELLKRPQIRQAIQLAVEAAEQAAGVDVSKERLLQELDWSLTATREAMGQPGAKKVRCPGCHRAILVTSGPTPGDIASLTIAIARNVEIAAKIIGVFAPARHIQQYHQIVGDYTEVVRMVRGNPNAFSPEQVEELRYAALRDREAIDELLTLFASAPWLLTV